MKKIVILVCCIFSVIGCNNNSIEKPDNLIDKDKMTDILYDMSLLEAVKSQNINGGLSSKVANDYIYKKYKIDSIQFVKSNKYYASNIEEYKKMFEKIKERLNKKAKKLETEMKKNGEEIPATTPTPPNIDLPQVQ